MQPTQGIRDISRIGSDGGLTTLYHVHFSRRDASPHAVFASTVHKEAVSFDPEVVGCQVRQNSGVMLCYGTSRINHTEPLLFGGLFVFGRS